MYSLHLTPEQLEFRDTVRDFVENEIKPVALHPDRLMTPEQKKRFLPEFVEDDRYHLAYAGRGAGEDAGWNYHRPMAAEGGTDPVAAINLGLGRAACEAAVEYSKIRRQGGRFIIGHQAIGGKLADCAIRLELARGMIWKAAWLLDHPEAVADRSAGDLPYHVIARVYTAEAVNDVALLSAECFGAMGVMRDMPLQKYVHDSMVFLHADDACNLGAEGCAMVARVDKLVRDAMVWTHLAGDTVQRIKILKRIK